MNRLRDRLTTVARTRSSGPTTRKVSARNLGGNFVCPGSRMSRFPVSRFPASRNHELARLSCQSEITPDPTPSGDQAAIDRAAIQTDMSALGRFLITKKDADTTAFKTPNLRNVLVTGHAHCHTLGTGYVYQAWLKPSQITKILVYASTGSS